MVPIISFAGKSNTGKTLLIEKLLVELKNRGVRASVLKCTKHHFEVDMEGKDTWRHSQAGAMEVGILTPDKAAVFINETPESIEEFVFNYFTGSDLIIVEGGKESNIPKFWLLESKEDIPDCPDELLLGTVGDFEYFGKSQHFRRDDIEKIANKIQGEFFEYESRGGAKVWIDGKPLLMKPFIQSFVRKTILGMLSSLKGAKKGNLIQIKIGRSINDDE